MKAITIHIRRILRNKLILAATVAIPLVMVLLGGSGSDMVPSVAVINHDGGPLSELVLTRLEDSYRIEKYNSLEEAEDRMRRGGLEYILQIPDGFGSELIAARTPVVSGVAVSNPHSELHVREAIQQVTRPGLVLAASLEIESEQALASAWQRVQEGPFTVRDEVLSRGGDLAASDASGYVRSMNLFTLVLLLMGLYGGMNLIRDRRNGTLMRASAAPGGLRGYIGGLLVALIVVQLLQVALTTVAAGVVFPQIRSAVLVASFGVMALFAVTSLAFGIALAGIAKNLNQLGVLGSIFIFPMAMLGGAFWPMEIMPLQLQRIGVLMPNYWAGRGIELALGQVALREFLLPSAILLMYAVLFFLLGSWKRDQVTSGREMRA